MTAGRPGAVLGGTRPDVGRKVSTAPQGSRGAAGQPAQLLPRTTGILAVGSPLGNTVGSGSATGSNGSCTGVLPTVTRRPRTSTSSGAPSWTVKVMDPEASW